MAEQVSSPRIQAWNQELENVGRVEIGTSFRSLIWRVGLAVAIVAIFIFVRYEAGVIGQRGLALAIGGFAILIIGSSLFVKIKYSGKSMVIERDGVTMVDGMRIPWTGVTDVTVYSDPRGRTASSVQVNLTEDAWNAHIANQGAGGKMLHKANKMISRNRAIIVPSYMDAPTAELAFWLNQYARGEAER